MGFSRRDHGTGKVLDGVVLTAASSDDLIYAALTPPAVELYGQTLTDLLLPRTVLAMIDRSNEHDVAWSVLREGAVVRHRMPNGRSAVVEVINDPIRELSGLTLTTCSTVFPPGTKWCYTRKGQRLPAQTAVWYEEYENIPFTPINGPLVFVPDDKGIGKGCGSHVEKYDNSHAKRLVLTSHRRFLACQKDAA